MPYEFVTKKKAHVCDLPDPGKFAVGDVIRCTAEVRVPMLPGSGRVIFRSCGRKWLRAETFWLKRPYWA